MSHLSLTPNAGHIVHACGINDEKNDEENVLFDIKQWTLTEPPKPGSKIICMECHMCHMPGTSSCHLGMNPRYGDRNDKVDVANSSHKSFDPLK